MSSITQVSSAPHIPVGKGQRSVDEGTNGYVPTDLPLLNCHGFKQRKVTRNEMQGAQALKEDGKIAELATAGQKTFLRGGRQRGVYPGNRMSSLWPVTSRQAACPQSHCSLVARSRRCKDPYISQVTEGTVI